MSYSHLTNEQLLQRLSKLQQRASRARSRATSTPPLESKGPTYDGIAKAVSNDLLRIPPLSAQHEEASVDDIMRKIKQTCSAVTKQQINRLDDGSMEVIQPRRYQIIKATTEGLKRTLDITF